LRGYELNYQKGLILFTRRARRPMARPHYGCFN